MYYPQSPYPVSSIKMSNWFWCTCESGIIATVFCQYVYMLCLGIHTQLLYVIYTHLLGIHTQLLYVIYTHLLGIHTQLLLATVPFLAALNLRLSHHHSKRGLYKKICVVVLALFGIASSGRWVWSIYYPYGVISILVGPGTFWTFCLYVYLFVTVFIFTSQPR